MERWMAGVGKWTVFTVESGGQDGKVSRATGCRRRLKAKRKKQNKTHVRTIRNLSYFHVCKIYWPTSEIHSLDTCQMIPTGVNTNHIFDTYSFICQVPFRSAQSICVCVVCVCKIRGMREMHYHWHTITQKDAHRYRHNLTPDLWTGSFKPQHQTAKKTEGNRLSPLTKWNRCRLCPTFNLQARDYIPISKLSSWTTCFRRLPCNNKVL